MKVTVSVCLGCLIIVLLGGLNTAEAGASALNIYYKCRKVTACDVGKTFSLKGKGIPDINSKRKGDIVISVVVETPTGLTAEQKKILGDFAKTLGEGDAAGGKRESFFKRLFK